MTLGTKCPVRDGAALGSSWEGKGVMTMANSNAGAAGGGAIYGLGMFGAWVFFWQQADAFWEYLYAIFQGVFWPAYMVYEAFAALS